MILPSVAAPEREPDAALIAKRLESWRSIYQPAGEGQEWLYLEMVSASVRMESAQSQERETRAHLVERATHFWEQDRSHAAEVLGKQLSRDPSLVASSLRQTRQGCDWLITRWNRLAERAQAGTAWSPEQCRLAHDLMGTPREFRDGDPWRPEETPLDLTRREIDMLERLKTNFLNDLDERERLAVCNGVELEPNTALNSLRRCESAAFQRFKWAQKQLPSPQPAEIAIVDETTEADTTAPEEVSPAEPIAPSLISSRIDPPTDAEYAAFERDMLRGLDPAMFAFPGDWPTGKYEDADIERIVGQITRRPEREPAPSPSSPVPLPAPLSRSLAREEERINRRTRRALRKLSNLRP